MATERVARRTALSTKLVCRRSLSGAAFIRASAYLGAGRNSRRPSEVGQPGRVTPEADEGEPIPAVSSTP